MSNPRIIGGSARGIRLDMVPGKITRPITDRVKESLFNIIGSDIKASRILDLFGGTGSVGIEALSRGADFARFLDLSSLAVAVIRKNLIKTKLTEKAEVHCMNALTYLSSNQNDGFDYVYIAPPQYKNIWMQTLGLLETHQYHLNSDGWVIVQIDPVEYSPPKLASLQLFDQRTYGSTLLLFYIYK